MKYDGTNLEAVLEAHKEYLEKLEDFNRRQAQYKNSTTTSNDIVVWVTGHANDETSRKEFEHLRADFSNWTLENVKFYDQDLSYAIFRNTTFSICIFATDNFNRADFSDAKIKNCTFYNCNFGYSEFPCCNVYASSFYDSSFDGTDFIDAQIECCHFVWCAFDSPNFNCANFMDTDVMCSFWANQPLLPGRDEFKNPPS